MDPRSVNSIAELSPKEASAFLKEHPESKLVDVRTDEEFATARIPGALLVNAEPAIESLLAMPKDAPIVVVCHHGFRSRQAAGWLIARGFTNVFNLEGGIDAWSTEVDPTIPRY
jgi:rhodanese-related sulfurtransferase